MTNLKNYRDMIFQFKKYDFVIKITIKKIVKNKQRRNCDIFDMKNLQRENLN